jgi:predicted GNAT family acetyltransferase
LDLSTFRADWAAEQVARLRGDGYEFLPLDLLLATIPASARSMYDLEVEIAGDVPNLEVRTQPSYETFAQDLDANREHHPYCVAALKENEVVAVANHRQREQGYFFSSGTGVRRAARGQGLAVATKLEATRLILEGGGVCLDTSNDVDNAAMLSINRKIGYNLIGRQFRYTRS